MEQLPEDCYKYNYIHNIYGYRDETFNTRFIAIKGDIVEPVLIKFGKHGGGNLLIKDIQVSTSDRYIQSCTQVKGYTLLDTASMNLDKYIKEQEQLIKQYSSSLKSAELKLKGFKNIKYNCPEFSI